LNWLTKTRYSFVRYPQVNLLIWLIPLLLLNFGENSLMAHNESLYAARAKLMFDSGNLISPWYTHHQIPGFYWIIAIFYRLFGVNEIAARIPAMIASILMIFVIYEIATILLGKTLAYLSVGILSVEFLWLQYSRLVAPDIPTLLLVFTAILCLLKSESQPRLRQGYGFLIGLCFGLGFFLVGFMIFLPMVALLPYVIRENYRHNLLFNPMLYVGFVVGLIPTFIWLWLSWSSYGISNFGELLQLVFQLGSREPDGNNILFYVWNIPLMSFPWFFFAVFGLVSVIRYPTSKYLFLLVGFPVVLLMEISLFTTRFSHYSLGIYPFIAMLAAIGLDWLGKFYELKKLTYLQSPITRNISYIFGLVGFIFLLIGAIILVVGVLLDVENIDKYIIFAIVTGLSCFIVPLVWICRYYFNQRYLTAEVWIYAWLVSAWLSIAAAGSLGLLSDFNPRFRTFFQQESITNITKDQSIHFVRWTHKYAELVYFNTPIPGKNVNEISELSPLDYAWIDTSNSGNLQQKYKVVDEIKDYQLIQILP
ncbi:MAG: glycosyltransferase family 39 protein, partial [Sphaerospermopsis sp. SIO1G2]|nr:glycosyltransferase family 39 protein [Sphaerospermopsis sp. SIO1G2]